jgi:hypothetical protein
VRRWVKPSSPFDSDDRYKRRAAPATVAGVGTQLLDRRLGVGREHAQRRCSSIEQRFGRDCHVIRGLDTGLILTSEK